MKPVPLILLLASVLLTSHIRSGACRPRYLPGLFDGNGSFKSHLDEVLLRAAGDNAASYITGEKIQKFLQRNPRVGGPNALTTLPEFPLDERVATSRGAVAHLARSLASWETEESALREEEDRRRGNSLDELAELTKRNVDPPISIDLTFHLLRNMIEMAKIESQRQQAELNRKFLDEVGK